MLQTDSYNEAYLVKCCFGFQFVCDPAHLNQVKGKLTKLGYNIVIAENDFLPNMRVSLADADLEAVQKLYDKLEEDPDIVKLYDNIS